MRHITSATPVVLSGALVIPAGLLRRLRGEPPLADVEFSSDPAARSRIEQLAMNAVRSAEEARGCLVVDVSAQKCGWDITSYPPRATLSALGRGAGGGLMQWPEFRRIGFAGKTKICCAPPYQS